MIQLNPALRSALKSLEITQKFMKTAGELLADPGIDAVHICTPNNTHAELAVQALENHKHVMCESRWPLTESKPIRWSRRLKRAGKY